MRRIARDDVQKKKQVFMVEDLTIDLDQYVVTVGSKKVLLTKKEN